MDLMRFGIPEVLVLSVFGLFWLAPIVAGIWALMTLQRIRVGQDELRRAVQAIEQRLQTSQLAR